jgi:hypothetical protein
MERPRRPRPSSDAMDDAVAFHGRDLRTHGIGGQTQLGGDVIDGQSTALKERDDTSATCIEQLLPEHW